MRLGVSYPFPYDPADPEKFVSAAAAFGCSTVNLPAPFSPTAEEKRALLESLAAHRITLGEAGVWKNTISPDEETRREAVAYAKERLSLADELSAGCCVNIAGAFGPVWDSYYPENYTADTYALIVDSIREIIDAVKPVNTFYTIEPMPWMVPDSPDGCLQLLKDVDRPAFGIHLDFANMINSIQRYHRSSAFIRECFEKLGPFIKSVHAKDVRLTGLPCRIEEALPGEGILDFSLVFSLCEALGPDMPVFSEHLDSLSDYRRAFDHLKAAALKGGVRPKSPC